MLLTNISVAQHIAVHLPEQALLRRHDTPIERRLVSFLQVCYCTTNANYNFSPHSPNVRRGWDTTWTLRRPALS